MVVWKDIENYVGLYQVSNTGLVKSLGNSASRKEKILKLDEHNGYKRVDLWKDGSHKRHSVHRLVALAFIENPNNYDCVNHIDEDKGNNDRDNLEWCNHRHNVLHSLRTRMILKIINEYGLTKEELISFFP